MVWDDYHGAGVGLGVVGGVDDPGELVDVDHQGGRAGDRPVEGVADRGADGAGVLHHRQQLGSLHGGGGQAQVRVVGGIDQGGQYLGAGGGDGLGDDELHGAPPRLMPRRPA